LCSPFPPGRSSATNVFPNLFFSLSFLLLKFPLSFRGFFQNRPLTPSLVFLFPLPLLLFFFSSSLLLSLLEVLLHLLPFLKFSGRLDVPPPLFLQSKNCFSTFLFLPVFFSGSFFPPSVSLGVRSRSETSTHEFTLIVPPLCNP